MERDNHKIFARYYDEIYLKRKDYQREAEIIVNAIKQFENHESKTLLDVGCGTGEHLKYLSSDFQCVGMDTNIHMIENARNKVSNVRFEVANMINFRLSERFDVIICLFSSIGYVQDFNNLEETFRNFHRHLGQKGIVIVEPWVFKRDFKRGRIAVDVHEDEKMKLARMATSKIVGSKWFVFMHYLVGEKGKIEYFKELHKMVALDYEDYVKAFKASQLDDVKFLKENLWDGCRGLFVATKETL